jgi:hypothetical protein
VDFLAAELATGYGYRAGAHTVSETARLRSIGWQAQRVAVTLSRLARASK